MGRRWDIFALANGLFLIMFALITLYPLWHELSLSFSSMSESMEGGAFFWPRHFTAASYESVLSSGYIWLAYKNSIFVTVVGTAMGLLLTASTAYPLIKSGLPAKKFLVLFVLFTMVFSGGDVGRFKYMEGSGVGDDHLFGRHCRDQSRIV